MPFDGEAWGREVAELVRDYVAREVAPLKAENEELKARLKALEDRPAPEKGDPGEPGEKGADGKDGRDGADGKDGAGIIDGFVSREGHLIATLSDGTTRDFGEIIGKDGAQGKDGKDGFSLDDFDIDRCDDGRSIVLKFERGDRRDEYELTFPVPAYCGVFKEGTEYRVGDMVTFGGSVWHCDKATTAKPGTDDWTLAVKKGRDGKDSKNG